MLYNPRPIINSLDLKARVKADGAAKTAANLVKSLDDGELKYTDFTSILALAESLIVDKSDDKTSASSHMLSESLSEDAASYVSADAFSTVAAQLFFLAFTTKYNSSDYPVKELFTKNPSPLTRGETMGGVSGLEAVLTPVGFGQELPTLEPTEDFYRTPPQRRVGCIINLTPDLVRQDKIGFCYQMAEEGGTAVGLTDEIEACSTLCDIDGTQSNGTPYTRTHHNWKGTSYDTYYTAANAPKFPNGQPQWQNLITGNQLVDWNNLNTAWQAIATTLNPFSQWPITADGKWVLVVPTTLAFQAARIKRSVQFRTGTEDTSNSILITAPGDSGFPVDFDIVVSKHLHQILVNNQATTGQELLDPTGASAWWFFGIPSEAFTWQVHTEMTKSQAVENAGHMFTRSLAASFKAERVRTAFVKNPRFISCNVPGSFSSGTDQPE